MVMFKAGSSCVVSLATVLVLVSPPPIEAQESEDGLSWREIGLVGLTVDMPDEQDLGRDCRWDNDPTSKKPRGECWLSLATLRDEGVPVVDVAEISLSDGIFGRERYRLAGRITLINLRSIFASSTSGQSTRWARARAPREAILDMEGKVVGYEPQSAGDSGDRGARNFSTSQGTPQVQAKVVWSLYDSFGSNVIFDRETKGLARDLGDAIFASLEEFVDKVSKEMKESARD